MQLIKSYHEIITSEIKKEKEKIHDLIIKLDERKIKDITLIYETLDVEATFSKEFLIPQKSGIFPQEEEIQETVDFEKEVPVYLPISSPHIPSAEPEEPSLSEDKDKLSGEKETFYYTEVSDDKSSVPLISKSDDNLSEDHDFETTHVGPLAIQAPERVHSFALNLYGMFSGTSSPPEVSGIDEIIFGEIWPEKTLPEAECVSDTVKDQDIEEKAKDHALKRRTVSKLKKLSNIISKTEELLAEPVADTVQEAEQISQVEENLPPVIPALTIYGIGEIEVIDHNFIQLKDTKSFDPRLVQKLREKHVVMDKCGSQPQSYLVKSTDLRSPRSNGHVVQNCSEIDLIQEKFQAPFSPIILPYPSKSRKIENLEIVELEEKVEVPIEVEEKKLDTNASSTSTTTSSTFSVDSFPNN